MAYILNDLEAKQLHAEEHRSFELQWSSREEPLLASHGGVLPLSSSQFSLHPMCSAKVEREH